MHKDFTESIREIRKGKINLGTLGSKAYEAESEFDLEYGNYEIEGITEVNSIKLDASDGSRVNHELSSVIAYDESILKFSSIEGDGILSSHCLVKLANYDYLASAYVTFHFYTRSEEIAKGNETIRHSPNPTDLINVDYSKEREEFILKTVPDKSILLVDGPLLGKNLSAQTVKMNKRLLEKDIFSMFIVKNSLSNMVIDSIPLYKSKYNSDIHWASLFLKPGERTNFFLYKDRINPQLSKYFCYIKPFNASPQRVEIHPTTYNKFKTELPSVMNLLYYYFIDNGDVENKQLRPIVIAEKFARKTIAMFDIKKILKYTGLTPTVNEERFNL